MIFGDYPCCEGPLALAVPEQTPVYEREACPHCGRVVWHKLSRIDPMSWTAEDFLAEFDVDDEAKTIEPKASA